MSEGKSRFNFPLFRRSSSVSTAKSSASSTASAAEKTRNRSRTSLFRTKDRSRQNADPLQEEDDVDILEPQSPAVIPSTESPSAFRDPLPTPDTSLDTARSTPGEKENPRITLEEATPEPLGRASLLAQTGGILDNQAKGPVPERDQEDRMIGSLIDRTRTPSAHSSQSRFRRTLLEAERSHPRVTDTDNLEVPLTSRAVMQHRKIWVKRAGGSATLVTINEEDLVDDVRDMILKKYANSLGRNFDAPDVTLRILSREHPHRHAHSERILGPEEPIARTLDAYYPGGQTVDEALIIDVPQRRTPRHSPRVSLPYYQLPEETRPGESGGDYFPPMPLGGGAPSPHLQSNIGGSQSGSHHSSIHSISILNTGQVPPLPSPGSRTVRHAHRPKYGRTHTSSPTVINPTPGPQSDNMKALPNAAPNPPPLPTPPIPERTATPPPRVSSPRPKATKRSRKADIPSLPAGLLDGAVPPINVLIVEDNIINLKLLEAFMKRLKVRWHTAMNGREAVTKWRAGGFHLVLMDIQLPVMNGLEATKEIRRLERVNNIGVFSSGAASAPVIPAKGSQPEGDDLLMNTDMFKSPVIIVALTASSLQSDRHEALAAGCNDFLTKPVNFVWLERKVKEWGCMQALIDFDGWRKWKDFSQTASQRPAPTPTPKKTDNNTADSKATITSTTTGNDSSTSSNTISSTNPGTNDSANGLVTLATLANGKDSQKSETSPKSAKSFLANNNTPIKTAMANAGAASASASASAPASAPAAGGAGPRSSSPTHDKAASLAAARRDKRSSLGSSLASGGMLSGVNEEDSPKEGGTPVGGDEGAVGGNANANANPNVAAEGVGRKSKAVMAGA